VYDKDLLAAILNGYTVDLSKSFDPETGELLILDVLSDKDQTK